MLNKHLIIFILVFFPTLIFAQSKLNVDVGGGTTMIKKDISASALLGLGYKVSDRIKVNLNAIYSKPEFEITKEKFEFSQISLEAEYSFIPESNINLSSVLGFSYLHFGDEIELKNNDGIGINLGVLLTFNNLERFNYGFRIVNTYSSIAYGGILSSNIYLRYQF